MRERGWTPGTWRRLPRRDKLSLLAFARFQDEQRAALRKGLSNESMSYQLEQVVIMLAGI